MGRLALIANRITKIEQAFLQDNVQALRHELRMTLHELEVIPENPGVRDEQDGSALDGPEPWL